MAGRSVVARLLSAALGHKLAAEIISKILDEAFRTSERPTTTVTAGNPQQAETPPLNGSCPFMSLPTELRRSIFDASMPRRDTVFPVTCGKTMLAPATSNRTIELMLINRRIKDEIAEILYEERTFAIHVHSGIKTGGIEFLNTGRFPLQYMTDDSDYRFPRFRACDQFGLTRIKKIELTIFPGGGGRHNALNTYYMTLALARLLDRHGDDKNRITSLKITVQDGPVTPTQCQGALNPFSSFWWDAATNSPTSTSIEGLSHIRLALYPFSLLSNVHTAKISLPLSLAQHVGTVAFTNQLAASMQAPCGHGTFENDCTELQIESMRTAFEDYILTELYGIGSMATAADMVTDAEHEAAKNDAAVLESLRKHTLTHIKETTNKRSKADSVEVGQFLSITGDEATLEDAQLYLGEYGGMVEKAVVAWFQRQM